MIGAEAEVFKGLSLTPAAQVDPRMSRNMIETGFHMPT